MSKKEITKEILSILGNFRLSENIQIKELVALYMKKQQEIERLNGLINIMELSLNKKSEVIKEVREYIESNDIMKVEKEGKLKGMIFIDKGILEILDKENTND